MNFAETMAFMEKYGVFAQWAVVGGTQTKPLGRIDPARENAA